MIRNNIEIKNLSGSRIRLRDTFEKIDLFCRETEFSAGQISISYINDPEMTRINNEYLSHEGSTDVISFNYSDDPESKILEGEILICSDQARRQAKEYRVGLENELTRLLFHGLLHLSGLDDTTDKERKEMQRNEDALLKKWSVSSAKFN